MNINFVSLAKEPEDRKSWSGTPYMVLKSLEKMGHCVSLLNYMPPIPPIFHRIIIKVYSLLGKITNKQYLYWFTNLFQRILKKEYSSTYIPQADLTFVVGQSFLIPTMLPLNTPIVFLCDATFSAVENYYPEFSNIFNVTSRQGNSICKLALENSSKIIMSSEWAKSHAINDYNIPADKISVVEFGANLTCSKIGNISRSYKEISRYRILFSGVHWERKGGRIAIECCDELVRLGYNIQLIVAGVDVPKEFQREYILPVGFLNKNNLTEYDEYIKILENAHLLLFPSKAECSAITLCEAAGFALPVFAYETGGLANYIHDGYNGRLLDIKCGGDAFASAIELAIRTGDIQRFSDNASNLYHERLNWGKWRSRVETIINEICEK